MVTLHNAQLIAVRVAGIIEPRPVIGADGFHDKRVIVFPMADRVAVPARVRIFGKLPAIGPDDAPSLLEHVEHEDRLGRVQDLNRTQFVQNDPRESRRIAHRR